MAEYHVACGMNSINAGILDPKNPDKWRAKSDVTDEVVKAAAQYLLEKNVSMKFNYNGKKYRILVEEM